MLLGVEKTSAQHKFFLMPYNALEWDIFHIDFNQLISLFIIYLFNIIINKVIINTIYRC